MLSLLSAKSYARRYSPEKLKHLRGLFRVGAYFGVVTLAIGAIQVRSARAELKNKTIELGRQMKELAGAANHDVNRVSINGQPLLIGSAAAEGTVAGVLDRYESYCQKNLAQPADTWRTVATDTKQSKPEGTILGNGVLRSGSESGREGTVICFTKGSESKTSAGEALKTFAQTGELGALGGLRYAYAYTSEKGNTIVLTAWTDDKFNLHAFAPEEGKDAIGADFPNLPRVPNTQRVMSAIVEGTPFGINLYKGGESPEAVTSWLDTQMHDRGWFTLDPELEKQFEGKDVKPLGRLYEKDGVVLNVASYRDEQGVMTAMGLAGVKATDGTLSVDGRKAVDMTPSERKANTTSASSDSAASP